MRTRPFFLLLFALLLAAHLCHSRVLWAEETLPLAAAGQMLYGKALFRDVWFDKPPLVALTYTLIGAYAGVTLRVFGAVYTFACCWTAWFFARRLWGKSEGIWAAALLAFFLTFDTPSAVLPLAADLFTVLPQLAAVGLAATAKDGKDAAFAGLCCATAMLFNVKAVAIMAVCLVFAWPFALGLAAGIAVPLILAAVTLAATNAIHPFVQQVWIWPSLYAASPHVSEPLRNGAIRMLNWSGFHLALIGAAAFALVRRFPHRWKWIFWLAVSLAGVAAGLRFFPRYFFQLLPILVLLAARGFTLAPVRWRWGLLALLIVPSVRFGPRYPIPASNLDPGWADLALDSDSQDVARILRSQPADNPTLYVWGYRPEIFVYTRFRSASRFLDSQALTGVPADRHLAQSTAVLPAAETAAARVALARSRPDFLVDGLSLFNPQLGIPHYPELTPWFKSYQPIAQTRYSVIYRRTLR